MTRTDFWLLVAFIFAAPRIDEPVAHVAMVCAVLLAIFNSINLKKP